MTPELAERVATLAANNRSGASTLLAQAVQILQDARREGVAMVEPVACALCAAQTSMAPIWNVAAVALRPDGETAVQRYADQVRRAPRALARGAVDLLLSGSPGGSLSVATVSASSAVHSCLSALSERCRLHVLCAEGRPMLEGRDLAVSLAKERIATTVCTDAAVGARLERVHAVLVGADAVSARWFINKCGTRQVAALADSLGVPVYVVASRDKFIGPPLDEMLGLAGGPAAEVWDTAPSGVTVDNPYFERVPVSGVASVITDAGVVGPGSVAEVCGSQVRESDASRLLAALRAAV